MVRLVCVDVDGTLVGSSGRVAPEVWTAAEEARAEGIHLAICSGRPAFGLAREYAERLDPQGWHVFQNGASVIHLATGESRSLALPPEAVRRLVQVARATGRILELYTDAEYAVESDSDRARRHAGLLGVPFRTRDFLTLQRPIVRAQWLLGLQEADPVLSEPSDGIHSSLSHSPVMADTAFINMTPAGVDKASAVGTLAALLGVPLERVMMVGDGLNDLGIMRVVGYPVAMGNAEPAVHAIARYRVDDVERHGLAEALALAVRLSWGPRSSAA